MSISPKLPFGDINVVVLTDVHGWVGGHGRQEPEKDIDYGDVLSFYQRLKAHCDAMGRDLWFVVNGDWAHGTGLSIPGNASTYLPILEKMPWDAMNCGNHELYESAKVEAMIGPGGLIDWFGDRYLTANVHVDDKSNKRLLGQPYKVLRGHSNLLVFGFLYNLGNPCELIQVQKVEEVVQEPWFRKVLKEEEYDAILILAHMDLVDPLVEVIRSGIRQQVGDSMPLQFLTGHTHYRGVINLDDQSNSFEAGKYLDTVGFVSFPTIATVLGDDVNSTQTAYQNVFIDASKDVLADTLSMNDYTTEDGEALSKFIAVTREKLGLNDEVGCAPHDFIMDAALEDEASLWRLYRDEVIPKTFFREENTDEMTSIMFIASESWRYDLYSTKPLTMDDVWAVAPFNDTIMFLGSFTGRTIQELNTTMNNDRKQWNQMPSYLLIGDILDDSKSYKLYTHDYGTTDVVEILEDINPNDKVEPIVTRYSSTFLWLTFVIENWHCDGKLGKLPNWFPTPDRGGKHMGQNANDKTRAAITIISVIFGLTLGFSVCRICWVGLRCIFAGHRPVHPNDVDAFEVGFDGESNCWKRKGRDSSQHAAVGCPTIPTAVDNEML